MAIPKYQVFMLPLLKIAGDGAIHSLRDAIDQLAIQFRLPVHEQKELLPSGTQTVLGSRISWARTYLTKALLIESPQRAHFRITERGNRVLAENPLQIDVAYLNRFSEFREFKDFHKSPEKKAMSADTLSTEADSPDDLMAKGYLTLREQIEQDLLAKVKACSPEFFEQLVVELLTAMGYGGSLVDAGEAIGRSGDGGVDGVIKEDKLGLEEIYIQAKRWDSSSVGRPEIQKFVGALLGKRSQKGIFLTTSTFTKEAGDYAEHLETKIVLIDGIQLAHLMFDFGIGVSIENTYEVKRIDNDFFEDDSSLTSSLQLTEK